MNNWKVWDVINFCSDHCIDSRLAQENEKKCENAFQQIVHSIKRADYQDIGINFIALPEFFEVPLSMLGGRMSLPGLWQVYSVKGSGFALPSVSPAGKWAGGKPYGKHGGIHAARICERRYHKPIFHGNCIFTSSESSGESSHNSSMDYKENSSPGGGSDDINSDCKNASLTRIAEDTHQSMTALSKLIKQKTGYNFQELLQRKRFQMAVHLLCDIKLSIEEIVLDVGYENQSYFSGNLRNDMEWQPHK